MSFNDISSLRKSGRLNDAYLLAKTELDQQPDDLWAKRAMAWVLYDLAKKNASYDNRDKFLKCLNQISSMAFPAEETMFWESVTWLVRSVCATMERNANHSCSFFTELFSAIRPLPLPKPAEPYSALLQTMLRLKTEWQQYPDFCQWWGLGNLRPEDYKPQQTADGKRILSLAERVFMGYTKSLLSQNRASDLAEWEPQLSKHANENPSYTYLPYYLAKVRLSLGKAEQVMESMKSFVKKKRGEFWVWELLGDATHDPDHRFYFYAKAMTCNTKDEMLVSMREKIVNQLIARKYYPEAHCELDRLLATRQKHQWVISGKLQSLKNEDWYIQTTSANTINTFYKPFAQKAEEVVLGTNTDECKTVRGVLKKNKAGFGFVEDVFVPSWLIENIENGENVELRAVKSFDKKKSQWGWKASKISKTPG